MIDCHVHVFPPKVGAKLADAIGEEFGRAPAGDGSVTDLLTRLDRAGLDGAICHTAAVHPIQMIPANTWMIGLGREHPRLMPFGTIHPEHPDWEKQLDRLERHGIRGLKLHPDLSMIPLDSPLWRPVWDALQGRFLVMLHMGATGQGRPTISRPRALARILNDFPGLECIAAHLGGLFWWEEALRDLAGRDLYLDTAACPKTIPPQVLRAILKRHDPQRILFGSDYPLFSPETELPALDRVLSSGPVGLSTILDNGNRLLQSLADTADRPAHPRQH